MNPPPLARRRTRGGFGFTLLEVVVSMALGSVVFAAALAAIVFLQKSYAATEQYASNLADQMRLIDYLAMDLRRAVNAEFVTSGGKTTGLTLTLVDYYTTDGVPNPPRLNLLAPYYGADPTSTFKVFYLFQATYSDLRAGLLLNAVTRQERSTTSPKTVVAAGMESFPDIKFYTPAEVETTVFQDALKSTLRIAFKPMFQTPATSNSNTIVLHGMTFLRNNDSHLH